LEQSFAELFDSCLKLEGVSNRTLEAWIRGLPPAFRDAPSSRQSISNYRKGVEIPTLSAWRAITEALATNHRTVAPNVGLALEQEWCSRGIAVDSFHSGETVADNNPKTDDLLLSFEKFLNQTLRESDRSQIERLLCRLTADLEPIGRQLAIRDGESGYFTRWLEVARQVDREVVLAYIRPFQAQGAPVPDGFYDEAEKLVAEKRLDISYIFLDIPVRSETRTEPGFHPLDRLGRITRLTDNIRTVSPLQFEIGSTCLRPSFVIFTQQKIVFTHERDDAQRVVDAQEWRTEEAFQVFMKRYRQIRTQSNPYKPGATS